MEQDQSAYFALINYLLVVNTVWVAGFGVLCFVWANIARTPAKKTIFGAIGGMLIVSVVLRLVVAGLPTNLMLLLVIGILHGLMLAVMFVGFLMVTVIVRKRMTEMDQAEQCRAEACMTPAKERWDAVEAQFIVLGQKAGWL